MNFCLSLMSLTATNGSPHIVHTPMQILVKLHPPLSLVRHFAYIMHVFQIRALETSQVPLQSLVPAPLTE